MQTTRTLLLAALLTFSTFAGAQKYVGGDISLLTKMEAAGSKYADHEGNAIASPLAFFREEGMNAMRVRLFVNPENDTEDENVCQDLAYVKALGQRIKAAGFRLMLDFHYSDTWADPSKQWTPLEWLGLSDAAMAEKIYDYTREALRQLVEAGATPDFIQVGNEVSYGMLWGASTQSESQLRKCYTNRDANWDYFTTLLSGASRACREVCPDARLIIHTDRVAQPDVLTGIYDRIDRAGVDYDIIGLSYYPYFHGDFSKLEQALAAMETVSEKDIMMVETGYPLKWPIGGTTFDYTSTYPYTDSGQQRFTHDLIALLNRHSRVTGLFWWNMEYNAYGTSLTGWYNAPLFDSETGRATSALSELQGFLDDASSIGSPIENSSAQRLSYTLAGAKVSAGAAGIYIRDGRKYIRK